MGKETTALKSLPAAVLVSYFTASEKENLRTKRKQNYVIKNEKKEKKLWLLLLEQQTRKMIEVVFSSRVSLLPFYSSEKVLNLSQTVLTKYHFIDFCYKTK